MKDLSSPIECVEADHLIINQAYMDILSDLGLNSIETVCQFSGGETIKKIKQRSVIRIKVQHQERPRHFYLKRHKIEFVGFQRLIGLFSQNKSLPHGRKEFQNICDFRRSGLPAASPVAAGEKYHRLFWVESFLITEDFYPFSSLEDFLICKADLFSGPERKMKRQALIREISSLARRMHRLGFNHRDFNATHILTYYEKGADTPKLALFDLQRVDQRKFFRCRWMIKSLARVNFTLPDELFDKEERLHLLLDYKGKEKPGVFDRLQWFYIKKKTSRIKRHTEKIMAAREARKDPGRIDR